MKGYIGHTDLRWWRHLLQRPDIREVNFWRPAARTFSALAPGEPFFFRLKSPINKIGGVGLFARYAALPVWRAWEVFGQANGASDEAELLVRLAELARRPVTQTNTIGCIAVTDCIFFPDDALIDVPPSFNPQNLSGSVIDLDGQDGQRLWSACLQSALSLDFNASWVPDAAERHRQGKPQVVIPRLGQGSFRIAVLEAYQGGCAVTNEHSMPALEAAHIQPFSYGGAHELRNGLPLRRDVHRLFDLGYVSVSPNGSFLVSPRLHKEFSNGRTYYALEGQQVRRPLDAHASPDRELLAWHSETIFQST